GDTSQRAIVGKQDVNSPVRIVIQETRAGAFIRFAGETGALDWLRRKLNNPRLLGRIHKLHRYLRQHLHRARLRLLRQRILSLLAIGQAHRRAKLVLGDVLEARQVLAGVRAVAGLLVSARESELRRGVQRIQLEGVLEGVNRLRKLLEL